MSFPVAVQSAIFYFLACTPCMAARARYRTRQQSKREREERARIDAEQPELYRQPSPFNVNPYWEEEIMMGPSLPNKKGRGGHHGGSGGSKNTSQRKLNSAGKDSGTTGTRSSLAVSSTTTTTTTAAPAGGGAAALVNPQESPTLVPDDARSMSVEGSDGWNYKRYQREDEELWGHEPSRTHKLMDAIVKAGSSAGRLLEGKLGGGGGGGGGTGAGTSGSGKEKPITDADRAKFYYAAAPIHPPVNDYHPPVVTSKPAHKDALKWMLQPPPPAKVMEGKVPVSRSASMASSIGRRTAAVSGSDLSLGRRVGERLMVRKGDVGPQPQPPPAVADADRLSWGPGRSLSRKSTASPRTRSRRSGSSLSTDSAESDEAAIATPKKRRWKQQQQQQKQQSTPRNMTPPDAHSEDEAEEHFSKMMPPSEPQHAAQRPKLETILSSDASSRVDFAMSPVMEEGRQKENISLAKQMAHSDPTPFGERTTGASIDSGLALST